MVTRADYLLGVALTSFRLAQILYLSELSQQFRIEIDCRYLDWSHRPKLLRMSDYGGEADGDDGYVFILV